jgi:Zn-dependent metalloprotease
LVSLQEESENVCFLQSSGSAHFYFKEVELDNRVGFDKHICFYVNLLVRLATLRTLFRISQQTGQIMKRLAWIFAVTVMCTVNAWSQVEADQALLHLQATQPSAFYTDDATGNISFLRWQNPLSLPSTNRFAKAQYFLSLYGPAFGLKSSASTFTRLKEEQDIAGNYHLRLQHFHEGIPVFSGTLNFHFNQAQELMGMDGMVLPNINKPSVASISPSEAREIGLVWLNKHYSGIDQAALIISNPSLQWFKEGLVQGLDGTVKLTYYLEIRDREHLRDYLLIDAQQGIVIEYFQGICDLAERRLFVGSINNPIWQDGDVFPANLSVWQQKQLHTTEQVYYLFKNTFGRISYDNLDGDFLMIDQASFLDCPNASWNGYSANFCTGTSSDDVVGHEWAHAYTEYTSDLLYAWQAGAINEAYSDIWGETLDILNSSAEEKLPRTAACNNGERWLIGEEAAALNGAIRDLWQPTCYGKPGKVSDEEYRCSTADFGGVHSNSGVVAHAYALLVDGGSYNDYEITGIGLDKAAHIFWQAQSYYLGRTSDFAVLANALTAAFLDLRLRELPLLSINEEVEPSPGVFLNSADSLALQQVIKATELKMAVNCSGFNAALRANPPSFCLVNGNEFTPFFTEDWEEGASNWLLSAHPVQAESWASRQWALTTELPKGRPGQGIYAANPNVGHCDTLLNNGILRLQSPVIDISSELEGRVYLTFDHYFSLEEGVDGGNVKIQQNGGNWMTIPTTAFLYNTYSDILSQPGQTNNPLAGQRVFSGADEGAVTGSWGTSQVDLTFIGVQPGETIRLRWELGTDGCGGWDGWYLDDVRVGTCAARILPVEWIDFTAELQQKGVLLKWSTAAEENNAGFFIERSTDGQRFADLGFVPAEAASGSTYDYLDGDLPIRAAYLYYRLRQEDLDGQVSYSSIREVKLQPEEQWTVYPNPARTTCTLSFPAAPFLSAEVSLRDLNGRQLWRRTDWQPDADLIIAVQNIPAGVYLIRIETDKNSSSQRIVIE